MKLYRTPTGHWAGNQDDARALAKQYDTDWEPCEVPDNKAGLLAFLNEHQVGYISVHSDDYDLPPIKVVATDAANTPVAAVRDLGTAPNPAVAKIYDRLAMEEAILEAPLDTAVALAELVMSRIRDFTRGK